MGKTLVKNEQVAFNEGKGVPFTPITPITPLFGRANDLLEHPSSQKLFGVIVVPSEGPAIR